MILHPIAGALSLLAVIWGLVSTIRTFRRIRIKIVDLIPFLL